MAKSPKLRVGSGSSKSILIPANPILDLHDCMSYQDSPLAQYLAKVGKWKKSSFAFIMLQSKLMPNCIMGKENTPIDTIALPAMGVSVTAEPSNWRVRMGTGLGNLLSKQCFTCNGCDGRAEHLEGEGGHRLTIQTMLYLQ